MPTIEDYIKPSYKFTEINEMMNDERLNRELDEILAMLKQAEHAAIANGQLYVLKDIAAIHIAVLRGYYDLSEAVEFLGTMYEKDGDNDGKD